MARKTRAERDAEVAAEREELRKEQADAARATWHRRVAALLLDLRLESQVHVGASTEDAVTWLKIQDCRLSDERFWCTPFFPLDLSDDDGVAVAHEEQLCRAEQLVRELKQAREEERRRAQLRNDALAKLSDEEREVLGL